MLATRGGESVRGHGGWWRLQLQRGGHRALGARLGVLSPDPVSTADHHVRWPALCPEPGLPHRVPAPACFSGLGVVTSRPAENSVAFAHC